MKTLNLKMGVLAAVVVFLGAASAAHAAPLLAQTWVSGTVFDGSHNPVNGGNVLVHCGTGTQTGPIQSNGTYAISFDQSVCKVGDTAQASASTGAGSGSNAATVQDTTVNGPLVDLDIAVIDINVPEFGKIGAVISAMGGIAGYLFMRQKQMI